MRACVCMCVCTTVFLELTLIFNSFVSLANLFGQNSATICTLKPGKKTGTVSEAGWGYERKGCETRDAGWTIGMSKSQYKTKAHGWRTREDPIISRKTCATFSPMCGFYFRVVLAHRLFSVSLLWYLRNWHNWHNWLKPAISLRIIIEIARHHRQRQRQRLQISWIWNGGIMTWQRIQQILYVDLTWYICRCCRWLGSYYVYAMVACFLICHQFNVECTLNRRFVMLLISCYLEARCNKAKCFNSLYNTCTRKGTFYLLVRLE